jgi:CubicO group peptidase (beta-lactamase class C family)
MILSSAVRSSFAVLGACALALASPAVALAQNAATLAEIDRVMEHYRLDAHIPGMVWGVVKDGKLVHVKAAGVQELDQKRPVTADTLFRIASMTKAFTALSILKLRDDGKLALDAPAETYVPELKALKYPTEDSPKIRVRELITHTAGFVTDDPWGDRQTPLPEADFTKYLASGVPFTRAPASQMESRTSATPARPHHQQRVGHGLRRVRAAHDPASARHDGDQPSRGVRPGGEARSAIAGKTTSGSSSPRWRTAPSGRWAASRRARTTTRSGWRSCCRRGRRATRGCRPVNARACVSWRRAHYPVLRVRPGASGRDACRMAGTYAMGFNAAMDCELGLTLSHGGGYPGYGSHVLVLPDHGVGIFALANRTYAGPTAPVWDAAVAMLRAGDLRGRQTPVSPALSTAYAGVVRVFVSGSVTVTNDLLAMNLLADKDADHWARDLAALKAQVGACDTSAPVRPTGALSGAFTWTCATGRVRGDILLAPTPTPQIQALSFSRVTP